MSGQLSVHIRKFGVHRETMCPELKGKDGLLGDELLLLSLSSLRKPCPHRMWDGPLPWYLFLWRLGLLTGIENRMAFAKGPWSIQRLLGMVVLERTTLSWTTLWASKFSNYNPLLAWNSMGWDGPNGCRPQLSFPENDSVPCPTCVSVDWCINNLFWMKIRHLFPYTLYSLDR